MLRTLTLGLIWVSMGLAADDRRAGKDPTELIPTDAAAFVQVRVKRFFDSPVGKQFAAKVPKEVADMNRELTKSYGLKVTEVESISYVWPRLDPANPAEPPVTVIVTREPYDRNRVKKSIGEVTSKEGAPKQKEPLPPILLEKDLMVGPSWAIYALSPDVLVAGTHPRQIAAYVELHNRKTKHGQLEPVFRVAMAECPLIAGIAGSGGIPWTLPKPLESLKPLNDATSMGMAVFIKDNLVVRTVAEFPVGKAADGREALGSLPGLAPVFANAPPNMSYLKTVALLIPTARAEVDGTTLRLAAGLPPEAVTNILNQMGGIGLTLKEKNDLREIGIALNKYHDEHQQKFPSHAIYSADGKPLLSWRVELLPTLGQKELYAKFKRDEPWDSDNNKKLIAEMPPVFFNTRTGQPKEKGLTNIQLFVGEKAAWPKSKESFGLKQIKDGTANTLMLVQAADPVIWTKPDDLEYDPQKPLPKLGVGGQPVGVMLFDMSVRELPATWPEKNWRAIITPAGGEPVEWPK
ncbi:MAG: DUF1559 domain-containing protein [Gemmataceae bacterium]